jgi:hypothetical protein
MAELRVKGTGTLKLFESDNTSSVTIASPASLGGDRTITLPDASVTLASGTMLATDGDGSGLSGVGKIGQCIQVFKSDVTSTTSTSFVAITGITLSITPSATSSKILVIPDLYVSSTADTVADAQLFRDTTNIGGDDENDVFQMSGGANSWRSTRFHCNFIDSPSTTSATTYLVKWLIPSGTLYLNRAGEGDNVSGSSTLTLMEILA